MKNATTKLALKNKIDQFSNLEAAFRWASNCIKPHIVMLGDNNTYWVVCFTDAHKLYKSGYEIAINLID